MLNRRNWMSATAGTLATFGFISTAATAKPKSALRVAHFTDLHIMPEREALDGTKAMFAHMFGRSDWEPSMVLNTGDTVMAIDGKTTAQRAQEQIKVWKDAAQHCPAPIYSCLGNHDVWNGHEPTDELPAERAGFGVMTDVLSMPSDYYSFDKGAWHFIALNSVRLWPDYGKVGDEQLAWLIEDLRKTPKETPVCILSHLPIVGVTSSVYGDDCRQGNNVVIPGTWQHADCWILSEVFRHHPNVKLCLSGHMHTCDRCEYRGVWYICGGAASGAWWNGSQYGFPPCYGQLDLFDDGTFSYQFVDYGWKMRDWQGKEHAF